MDTEKTTEHSIAGFVLTGGASSRMGRDKAALPFRETTLLEHVAAAVSRAVHRDAILIGAPDRYTPIGLPAIEDSYDNCGPLGGLCTALEATNAEYNLVVACDMPGVTSEFLTSLLQAAQASAADCLIPQTSDGLHPLCAVYHRRVLPTAQNRISLRRLKMHDFIDQLQVIRYATDASFVENINTPQDWQLHERTVPSHHR
jgi:molybdenum cofactor guanylyltransferase